MTVPVRLGLFLFGVVAAAGIGAAAGALVPDQSGAGVGADDAADMGHDDAPGHDPAAVPGDAGRLGLHVAAGGYRLAMDPRSAGGATGIQFTILGADGDPVREFTEENQALLHLIVVRRDLSGFQHLHPVLDAASGTWSTPVRLDRAGTWRLIVDAVAADRDEPTPVVLGADIEVAGEFAPAPRAAAGDRAAVDGYELTLVDPPTTDPGLPVVVTVERDGVPAEDLEPYLGNAGHLVALRAGDVAYVHLHADAPTGGPELRFAGGLPSAGSYRLFVQFAHRGEVHTADFTVEVSS
ncbi:MAG: hypothetical protein ACRD0A_03410 [Acidimicrobiales bacterium]